MELTKIFWRAFQHAWTWLKNLDRLVAGTCKNGFTDSLGISGSLRPTLRVIMESCSWNIVLSQLGEPFTQRTESWDFISPTEETEVVWAYLLSFV